jgi:hypothetical protein
MSDNRTWFVGVVAAAVSLLSLALIGGPVPAGATMGTVTKKYTPFGPQGQIRPDLTIRDDTGSCWTGSLVAPRPDAWRCMTPGAVIFDPCFSNSSEEKKVVCALAPWDDKVTVLKLEAPLPHDEVDEDSGESGQPAPWALVLDSGDRCVFLTGATDLVNGQRIDYACRQGGYALAFHLEQAGGQSTVQVLEPGSDRTHTEQVLEIWR